MKRHLSAGLLLLLATTAGCQTVEFYEKRLLAEPIMDLAEDPTEAHFHRKVFYSTEGAAGGLGQGAGGGCGCY